MNCYRTTDGHWFHASPATIGEMRAIIDADGNTAFRKVVEMVDRHVLFSQSDYDVLSVDGLEPPQIEPILLALMSTATPLEEEPDGSCHRGDRRQAAVTQFWRRMGFGGG